MNQFVQPDNPCLKQIAKPISSNKINSPKVREIIDKMLKISKGEQKDRKKPVMVGLAAPQIGITKRIILVDVKADGKGLPATPRKLGLRGGRGKVGNLRVYINPEIIWKSKKEAEWYEGCYSTGNVCGIVSRPTSIKIQTLKITPLLGDKPTFGCNREFKKYSGYVARIFQHEIDHLNGIRFPDLIVDPAKLHWVKKSEFPLYRDGQAWKNWSRKCSFEKWQKLKNPLLKKA